MMCVVLLTVSRVKQTLHVERLFCYYFVHLRVILALILTEGSLFCSVLTDIETETVYSQADSLSRACTALCIYTCLAKYVYIGH